MTCDTQTHFELLTISIEKWIGFGFSIFFQETLEIKNKELIALKQQQIEKFNTLIVLQGELNAINEEQKYHAKLRTKHALAAKNRAQEEKDFQRLLDISKHQKEQIKKITTEIRTLRLKIKPQDQFLLNEREIQDRNTPQVLTFPGYALDACDDSQHTHSTNSYSGASGASSSSAESKK